MLNATDIAGLVVPTSWVPKVRLLTDSVALGAAVIPTPLKDTDWGLPAVSSVMVRAAERGPIWLGVKVTLIAQLAPAARLGPQVVVWLNSAALDPAMAMLLMTKGEVAVLVSVSGIAALVLPTNSLPKFKLAGNRTRLSVCCRIETV